MPQFVPCSSNTWHHKKTSAYREGDCQGLVRGDFTSNENAHQLGGFRRNATMPHGYDDKCRSKSCCFLEQRQGHHHNGDQAARWLHMMCLFCGRRFATSRFGVCSGRRWANSIARPWLPMWLRCLWCLGHHQLSIPVYPVVYWVIIILKRYQKSPQIVWLRPPMCWTILYPANFNANPLNILVLLQLP